MYTWNQKLICFVKQDSRPHMAKACVYSSHQCLQHWWVRWILIHIFRL